MLEERCLKLPRADPNTAHVHHVVAPAEEQERSVRSSLRVVPLHERELLRRALSPLHHPEVCALESVQVAAPVVRAAVELLPVAPDCSSHAGQRRISEQQHNLPTLPRRRLAQSAALIIRRRSHHARLEPRHRRAPRVGGRRTALGERPAEDDRSVLGRPVGVDVVPTDVLGGEGVHRRRDRLGAERRCTQRREVAAAELLHGASVRHHLPQEG